MRTEAEMKCDVCGCVTAPIAGRWVSRSAYDETLNAIMEGDKRLEAAIARAEKAEAELAQRPEATCL